MSDNITFLTDNEVSFSYNYSVNTLSDEYFEDVEFSTSPDLDSMLDALDIIRKCITAKFHTKSMPDMYGLVLLLLMLKIDNEPIQMLPSWAAFSKHLRFNIPVYGVKYPRHEDVLKCLCGHFIDELFIIEQGGFYCPMGSTCITKSNIYNYNEIQHIIRVDCEKCGKNCPRIKPYDLTTDICKRCVKKVVVFIPPPIITPQIRIPINNQTTVVVAQKCVGCYKSIDTNPYRPRCKSCWYKSDYNKYKPIPFVERRTV